MEATIASKDKATLHIGISEENREAIANGLSHLLADSYMLYLKSQNYHWNVTGPQFTSLHNLFEEHYTELAEAIDVIAERIRALGHYSPGTFNQFAALSNINEEADIPSAEEMVRKLVEAHEQTLQTARKLLPICDQADDEATLDLATQRLQVHSKAAWMLRSHLG